jgi:hypothetical protein
MEAERTLENWHPFVLKHEVVAIVVAKVSLTGDLSGSQ